MKVKLIIADDHLLFAHGLKELLAKSFSIEMITVVNNGKEAIEACLKNKADCVIMDVDMPVMDGIYACRELKRMSSNIKVIILTMHSDLISLSTAWSAGADAYLLKGNDVDEVLNAFDAVMKNKRYVCDALSHLIDNRDKPNQKIEAPISTRETDVLKLICQGLTNEVIAKIYSISCRTVDTHRNNMLIKLKLPNTAALVRFAIENKLV
ncbi:MAG TPA: response regulator transcription factor [Bacteroidia bacterium]|nr:response regulator transcription factor [Bacteroidota bacterium]HNL35440.1 response regulator transcription factor [Bacteroidia bacterium]HNN10489.1 response regulator transcription factor [Bacteroidia bacterium]